MAHELGTDRRISTISVDRELHEMILGKYWEERDGFDQNGERRYAPAYRRALAIATDDYELTADDYQRIADQMRIALAKRLAKRATSK